MEFNYILFNLTTCEFRTFGSAEYVASFLWGKDTDVWRVFQRQRNLPIEVPALHECLERRERQQE